MHFADLVLRNVPGPELAGYVTTIVGPRLREGGGISVFQLPNVGQSRHWPCTSLENERISVLLAQRDEVLGGSAYRGTEKNQIFYVRKDTG